jgi:N-methylhydantoinase A
MYLGIDVGGTFTDLVLMDEGGNISTAKAPTTPGELEKGVFDAVAVAAKAQGLGPEELLSRVTAFGHGTTQATNALIERTGATTGLITTRGFGDTLALQRLMGFTAGIPVEHLGRYSRAATPIRSCRAGWCAKCANALIRRGAYSFHSAKTACAARSAN